MSGPSDKAAEIQPENLTAETVAAWLRRHPDFLQENPEVLTFLTPPEFKRGERILDMQHFMLERMRDDLTSLRRHEKQLMSAVEGNAAGQSKVHQAVTAIVGASDIQALNGVIRNKLPAMLDIESAVLCIEDAGALALAGATAIGTGGIENLMGPKKRILLQGQTTGESFVFGDDAARVKSVAYLRLRAGKNSPDMLLALGSGREDGFDANQATDLITFLADVLEGRLKQCLGPKN
tara:strand:+ start:1353 stop:2060 length:708 start_codon:yes stop_codon:yes gene_type:complete